MLIRFLRDDRGAMVAEYALLLAIACGCLAFVAFKLGDQISIAMKDAADLITAEAEQIKRGG